MLSERKKYPDNEFIDVSLNILYHFFYFEPSQVLLQKLVESQLLDYWRRYLVIELNTSDEWLSEPACLACLQADHLALFVGLGMPESMPWGSVYLHEDNLLLQESTYLLESFLRRHGLIFQLKERQPVDHIGLCLSALVHLLRRYRITADPGDQRAIVEFLSIHLLPWGGRFCSLLIAHAKTPFYQDLGRVTRQLLLTLQREYQVSVEQKKLYWPPISGRP